MDCKSIRNLVSASVISLVLGTSCEGITGPASADDFPWDPQEEAAPEEPVIKSLEEDEDWGRVTYHGIPVIYVRTQPKLGVSSKEKYFPGFVKVFDPDHMYGDVTAQYVRMGVKGRGNSTWDMKKQPFKLEFDREMPVFGLPADEDWVLLANYSDKSLLRNMVAMEVSRICGMKWTPAMFSVDLYLNDTYRGVYTFCESKKVAKHRVDIDAAMGGAYIEIDQAMDEPVCWRTTMGAPAMFIEPSLPSDKVKSDVKNHFAKFEDALLNQRYGDVYKLIDVDSFIANYIVQEVTKNIDGNLRRSTFMTLPLESDRKLDFYHVWDFDLSLGNCYYLEKNGLNRQYGNEPEGFYIKDRGYDGVNTGWYYHLFKDPEFTRMVKERWIEIYPQLVKVNDYIDREVKRLDEAQVANFVKWPILHENVWPNYKVMGSYEGEITYLKEFYNKRITWLNEEIRKW